jgi:diaminopimelate decarboxylase
MIRYRNNKLYVENVPVDRIAESTGTPVYIYSKKQLLSNYRDYASAFANVDHLVCYALKANSNLSLLKLLAEQGSGADIVSGGELYLALKAGIHPQKIVFAGVGKTPAEVESALQNQILSIHAESEQELFVINEIARKLRLPAPISLRVNPDIHAKTHPYISTGLKKHKFGIPFTEAQTLYSIAAGLPHLRIQGIHMHLGSQIASIKPFREAVKKAFQLMDHLQKLGIHLRHLDIGGGLAVSSKNSQANPHRLASVLLPLLKGRELQLILEPGRSVVASAGILLTSVLYTKRNGRKRFVIVDAGMNDFIRPALYGANHPVVPGKKNGGDRYRQDIVGPVCESGDFFAKDRELVQCFPGDLMAITEAGAYGYSMSSNYNSRLRPPEVLVNGSKFHVIRKRESYLDLIHGQP